MKDYDTFLSILARRTAYLGDHSFRHYGTSPGIQSSPSSRVFNYRVRTASQRAGSVKSLLHGCSSQILLRVTGTLQAQSLQGIQVYEFKIWNLPEDWYTVELSPSPGPVAFLEPCYCIPEWDVCMSAWQKSQRENSVGHPFHRIIDP